MSKSKDNMQNLLAAIQRSTPEKPLAHPAQAKEVSIPESKGETEISAKSKRSQPLKKSKSGKAVQFWLYDDDLKLVRELSAWLAGQGVRPTDSGVIRAALRVATVGSGLLQAHNDAAKLDARIKQTQ